MNIGVVSDTHANSLSDIPESVVKALKNVDLIVHAGDFTVKAVLDELRDLANVKAVCGNMDSGDLQRILPKQDIFIIKGKRIGLVHGTGARWGIASRIRGMFDDVDIIIYGHSHEPDSQTIRGALLFNPGPVNRSFGLLTIEDQISAKIIAV